MKTGPSNSLYVLAGVSLVALVALGTMLGPRRAPGPAQTEPTELLLYCAAGMRYAVEEIIAQYQRESPGVTIVPQYEGSNTLLNKLEVSRTGDLFLSADESYVELAQQRDLVAEVFPLARTRPVIVVRKDSQKLTDVKSVTDLLRDEVKLAIGNPDAGAIGALTRKLLTASGHWSDLERHVTAHGVFKPTVNEVANDVKLGSVDAGIVWDSTVAQYAELRAVSVPELDAGVALVEVAVLKSSKLPIAALRFARYLAARDKGLEIFRAKGLEVVDGDAWSDQPTLTFYAGAVNRRAIEPIIKEFEQREGVRVNTVFNGCGILTATMRTMKQDQQSGFPDVYMACDVYYLDNVRELFEEGVLVSETDIVIAVQKGNPKQIASLKDLVQPGIRVAVGQPEQCTIGILSRKLLEQEGLYEQLIEHNVVTQTATSSLLVPSITTGSADAVLAYATDCRAAAGEIDVITINSPLAKAVQPFSLSQTSRHKQLGRRLFETIRRSRDKFESVGFNWRLDEQPGSTAASIPP